MAGSIGSRRRTGAGLAAAITVLIFGALAAPAAAQDGAGSGLDACRRARVAEERMSPIEALRSCLPDPEAFDRCYDGDPRLVETCVAEQAASTPGTAMDRAEESPTTTPTDTAVTTEAPSGPDPTPTAPEGGGSGIGGEVTDGPTETSTDPTGDDGSSDGFGLPIVLLAAVIGALIGGGAVAALKGRRPEPQPLDLGTTPPPASGVPAPRPTPTPSQPPAAASPASAQSAGAASPGGSDAPASAAAAAGGAAATTDNEAAGDRSKLIDALIDLADQVQSDALRAHAIERLAAVGVEAIRPEPGTLFDPAAHRGVQGTPTEDPDKADTIAALDRPGFVDRGRTIRPPEVVVYLHEDPQ